MSAKAGVDYWIYEANADWTCGVNYVSTTGNNGDRYGLGHGPVLLDDPPAEVTQSGQTYAYIGDFFSDGGGTVEVHCRGGRFLVEAPSPSWTSYPALGLAGLVALTLLAEANIVIWRRSRNSL